MVWSGCKVRRVLGYSLHRQHVRLNTFISAPIQSSNEGHSNMDIYSAIVTGDPPPPHSLYRSTQWRLTAFVNRKVLEKYGPLPAFTHTVVTRIMENKLMPKEPDHLLVNEYNAGQGIMPHTGKCVTKPTPIHDFDVVFVCRCTCSFRSCHPILVIVISLCNEVYPCGERKFSGYPITYVQSSTTTMEIINTDAIGF